MNVLHRTAGFAIEFISGYRLSANGNESIQQIKILRKTMLNIHELNYRASKPYRIELKHTLDTIVSVALLILVFPAMVVIAICIYLSDRGPIFFVQQRIGESGKEFSIIKFRSFVRTTSPQSSIQQPDRDQLTFIGPVLRRFKLDELPQLLNVILGDMSLVGPRPLVVKDILRWGFNSARRADGRPGITGLAQICGNNALSADERYRLDLLYLSNQCLSLDLKILLLTLPAIVMGETRAMRRYKAMSMMEFSHESDSKE